MKNIYFTVFSGDSLVLNSKMIPNARATSLDGYSECEYTRPLVTLFPVHNPYSVKVGVTKTEVLVPGVLR